MAGDNRTKNSIINFLAGGSLQVIYIIASFIARTIFISLLNADYLGINGLFTNILTILSFSELGISSTIVYNMYKPAAEKDLVKLSSLLNVYRIAYKIVSIVVLAIGILITPLLPFILSETPDVRESITLIYLLFVGNTASSYVFSYRKSLFTVHQKDYLAVAVDRSFQILILVVQCLYLFLTHDYYGYLILQIVATLIPNIITHFWAGRKYKDIISASKVPLDKEEQKKIMSDVGAIFFYKVGVISMNSTSNILITKIINVTTVGLCSNYVMVINAVETVLSRAFSGVVASIGNLNTSKNNDARMSVVGELTTLVYWIYGFCSIALALLLNPLITVWLGDSYLIPDYVAAIALVSTFYVFGMNLVASNFRTTMGYFQQVKFIPAIAAVMNIVLGIVLGNIMGLVGIYLATTITRVLTFCISDPWVIHKRGFNTGVKKYFLKQIGFTGLTIANAVLCYWLISLVTLTGFIGLILKGAIVVFVANLVYFAVLHRTPSFRMLVKRIKNIRK